MTESYTGDEGDDALAAGLPVMDGGENRWKVHLAINKTRDWIVNYVASVFPISVARGGTGSTTAANARTALGVTAQNAGAVGNDGAGYLRIGAIGGNRVRVENTGYVTSSTLAYTSDIPSVDLSLSGHLYVPNSFAASSGWTVAYINADGRLSRGSSSARYKEDIEEVDPVSLGDLFPPLVAYKMRGGDGEVKFGYIADYLAEVEATERFVVYAVTQTEDGPAPMFDDNGAKVPESIDFIGLLMAQNAQLNARLTALESA